MTAWRVVPTEGFARQLRKLDRQTAARVIATLDAVVESGDPRSRGRALGGPLAGLRRYRGGSWRVLCELRDDALVVLALEVGKRDHVYD